MLQIENKAPIQYSLQTIIISFVPLRALEETPENYEPSNCKYHIINPSQVRELVSACWPDAGALEQQGECLSHWMPARLGARGCVCSEMKASLSDEITLLIISFHKDSWEPALLHCVLMLLIMFHCKSRHDLMRRCAWVFVMVGDSEAVLYFCYSSLVSWLDLWQQRKTLQREE